VNGDGWRHLIAAPDFDGLGGSDCGMVEVYLGSPSNNLVNNFQGQGWQVGDHYGFGLAGGGDVNNDGYSDMVIGAPWMNGAASDGGGVFLHLGGPAGVGSLAVWAYVDTDDWSNFGYSVSIAGDVTGDGFSDPVFGQPFAGAPIGRIACFYGGREIFPPADNGSMRMPRQFRTDGTTPVALTGTSDATDGFVLSGIGRSARGRTTVQIEYQISPVATGWTSAPVLGDAFDTGAPVAGSGSAVVVTANVAGLQADTKVHWRVRFRSASPFFPVTSWCSVAANGGTETDLRTAAGGPTSVDGPGSDAGLMGALRFSRVSPNPSRLGTSTVREPGGGRAQLTMHDASGRIATL
jgi:hypothetical protein